MVQAIISIIMAIIGFFTSKKSGKSNAQSALYGAAAGLGTYYVTTQTEWGKQAVGKIEGWVGINGPDGKALLDEDGNPLQVPPGTEIKKDSNGQPVTDGKGGFVLNIPPGVIDNAGKIAGGAFLGAGVAKSVRENPILWIGGASIIALILTRR